MSELITVDGVKYRKVDREAEVGELIVIVDRDEYEDSYENGEIAEVESVEIDGDVYAKFANGDSYFVLRAEYEVLVESYPKTSVPIEDEIYELKAKIAELEARVEAEKKQAEPERLKVGDYARVVQNVFEYSVGDIVKISSTESRSSDFKVDKIYCKRAKQSYGYINEKDIILATPEEVAEAKAKLEAEKVKAEEEAKWAKLGRKVGEFKVGDVVRVKKVINGAVLKEGEIGVISGEGHRPNFKVPTVYANNCHYLAAEEMELIAPVESVVNLSVQG